MDDGKAGFGQAIDVPVPCTITVGMHRRVSRGLLLAGL